MRASRGGEDAALPEPIMPAHVDLREFPYMPVDIARLFGSQFHATANDAEWRAGFTLWLKSYHQVPASSIPDDDVALARLAEFGRDVKGWKKVKAGALRGWVKCSDGRLYHEVVGEKVAIGWNAKQQQQWKRDCDRVRKENKSRSDKGLEALPVPNRPSDIVKFSSGTHVMFRQQNDGFPPERSAATPEIPAETDPDPSEFPLENGLKGKGKEREREGTIAATQQSGAARAKRLEPHDDGSEAHAQARSACVEAIGDGHPADPVFGPIMLLVDRGIPLREILTVLRSEASARRERGRPPIKFWSKWAEIVVERLDAAPKVVPLRQADVGPNVDFGNGEVVTEQSVRAVIAKGLWIDRWGPKWGQPGCRLPQHLSPDALRAAADAG